MKLRKNKLPDMRWKENRNFVSNLEELREFGHFQRRIQLLGAVLFGTLAGIILAKTLYDYRSRPLIDPRGRGEIKVVKEVGAEETPYCYDPITCIRDVGEGLGVPNKDIMTMIRIARCESNMNPMAINKNKNGTYDIGLLQLNDVHNKRINRQDRMDFEKNIRFAYKLYQEQGFRPWVCWRKVK